MSEIKNKIFTTVKSEDWGISQRELARKTGYSRPTVRKYCEELVRENLVEQIRKGGMLIYRASEGDINGN